VGKDHELLDTFNSLTFLLSHWLSNTLCVSLEEVINQTKTNSKARVIQTEIYGLGILKLAEQINHRRLAITEIER
jgi:hypothetical protein